MSECQAAGGERALQLTRHDGDGENCRWRSSAVGEARPPTGQESWKVRMFLEGRRRVAVSSCPSCAFWTLWDLQALWLGTLLQKLRKTEKKCLTQMSSSLTCRMSSVSLRVREKTKEDTALEAVDMATIQLKGFNWGSASDPISIQERRVWTHCLAIQVNSKVLLRLRLEEVKGNEDYTATDHSFFFLSFELESFLNKGCV